MATLKSRQPEVVAHNKARGAHELAIVVQNTMNHMLGNGRMSPSDIGVFLHGVFITLMNTNQISGFSFHPGYNTGATLVDIHLIEAANMTVYTLVVRT